jgi:hypothetical protein
MKQMKEDVEKYPKAGLRDEAVKETGIGGGEGGEERMVYLHFFQNQTDCISFIQTGYCPLSCLLRFPCEPGSLLVYSAVMWVSTTQIIMSRKP